MIQVELINGKVYGTAGIKYVADKTYFVNEKTAESLLTLRTLRGAPQFDLVKDKKTEEKAPVKKAPAKAKTKASKNDGNAKKAAKASKAAKKTAPKEGAKPSESEKSEAKDTGVKVDEVKDEKKSVEV